MRWIAALMIAAPAAATPALSFEQTMHAVRREVMTLRAEQVQAKSAATASEIERLGQDLGRYYWDAQRLRNAVRDLRNRASRHDPRDPRREDPFLRHDVQRAVWSARDLSRDVRNSAWRVRSLAASATPDQDSVAPAQRLLREARRLASETRWLESDARWAAMDLRRAGYSMEGWDLERETRDADQSAQEAERDSARLADKVRPPETP